MLTVHLVWTKEIVYLWGVYVFVCITSIKTWLRPVCLSFIVHIYKASRLFLFFHKRCVSWCETGSTSSFNHCVAHVGLLTLLYVYVFVSVGELVGLAQRWFDSQPSESNCSECVVCPGCTPNALTSVSQGSHVTTLATSPHPGHGMCMT